MGKTAAILSAALIFAGLFIMAFVFKFAGMQQTASCIAAAGFPFPLFLAWVAAFFEVALAALLPHWRLLQRRHLCWRAST